MTFHKFEPQAALLYIAFETSKGCFSRLFPIVHDRGPARTAQLFPLELDSVCDNAQAFWAIAFIYHSSIEKVTGGFRHKFCDFSPSDALRISYSSPLRAFIHFGNAYALRTNVAHVLVCVDPFGKCIEVLGIFR